MPHARFTRVPSRLAVVVALVVAALGTVSALAPPAHAAAAFWVDPVAGVDTNPGTSAAPFRTLQKALSKGVVAPGDTINLKPGNYNEAVATQVPGTQAAPITIKGPGTGKVADPAVQAVLRGLGGRVFSINHSWYTLTGFAI